MPHPPSLHLVSAGRTDVGRTRSRNEDCFGLRPEIGLALVCDGMGGHAGGDVASRTTVDAITEFVEEFAAQARPLSAVDDAVAIIRSAVDLANRRLLALNRDRGFPVGRGMGTTLVGLWHMAGLDKAVVFHAGDSRLYRLRGSDLRQVTRDHSLYQVWLDSGARGPAPQRNIIIRALGTAPDTEADVAVLDLRMGDVLLLCTDGLTGMVPDSVIADVLSAAGGTDPAAACSRLVDLANDAGGHDNVTVVLSRVTAATTA
ncbi:PP2C family protein-serine/threonine phosphatase [Azospirillum halopraeferens]|uniref:PP2C family protein-serine/threonine phosphatase n=1 Tax=Azospirillum halopraeferens TaxID=34010 RepID=UPI00048DA412|nr:PP2C family serine/threonine-protein phosphatase [Azospirillum halopraeferens]